MAEVIHSHSARVGLPIILGKDLEIVFLQYVHHAAQKRSEISIVVSSQQYLSSNGPHPLSTRYFVSEKGESCNGQGKIANSWKAVVILSLIPEVP